MLFSLKRVCPVSLTTLLAAVLISGYLTHAAEEAPKPLELVPEAAQKPDPFVVPDGTPEELVQYLGSLRQLQPESRDRQTVMEFLGKLAGATTKAADKILAAKATVQQKKEAAGAKFGALMQMARFGDPAAAEALKKMPEQFTKLGMPELARAAQGILLQMELQKATAGAPGAKKLDDVVDAIKTFVAEQPDRGSFGLAYGIVSLLEQQGKTDEAAALCDEFAKVYSKSADENAAKLAKTLQGMARRMKLVGNPIELAGTTVEGKVFDWAKYKDKVVLVQFWATWCEPCMAEMPHIAKFYELYHKRGFDVVGINLDESREALEGFLRQSKLPWTILFNNGEGKDKAKHPNAEYYGVVGIPTMFLVGKDGKVLSVSARGPKLAEELEKLLGPAEEKAEAEVPEVKAAT